MAVVFGGRSGEHPSPASRPAGVLANLDTDLFDVTAIGITPEGSWLQVDPGAIPLAIEDGRLPAVTSRRRAGRCRPTRPAAAMVSLGPDAGARDRRSTSTWCSRCCTARTARTAPSRACWSWPACPTSAPGCWPRAAGDGQGVHQEAAGRRGSAGRRLGGAAAGRADARPRTSGSGSACRCSSSRPGPARRLGVSRVDSWADLDASDRARPADRSQGAGRGRGARPGDRVRGAGVPRRPDRGVADRRRSTSAATTTFYDFDAKYLDDVADLRHPGRPAGGGHRADPGAGPCGRSRAGRARAWPGWTSSSGRRRRGGDQRGQHDARLHPDLDVPADVGRPAA